MKATTQTWAHQKAKKKATRKKIFHGRRQHCFRHSAPPNWRTARLSSRRTWRRMCSCECARSGEW